MATLSKTPEGYPFMAFYFNILENYIKRLLKHVAQSYAELE